MDNFIVSARKYRPETFTSVVGQSAITNTLKNAIQHNHLGHAYLFCGPRGVGKTTCARIFAKTINCTSINDDAEPCNTCESCTSFNESRAFNIHELDAASNNSVDDIRNLTEQVRIPPQVGKYSIYIIDEVHMLSAQAFNAFLKTLEEPPAHAVFILATTEKHKIIPTILSRCQIFDFNRIKVDDIVAYLEFISKEESIEYEVDAYNIIALKADGAMRDALSIFDQIVSFSGKSIKYEDVIRNLNILDYDYYFRITEACLGAEVGESLMIFNEILENGFDEHNFLVGLSSHMRDLLVCQDPVTLQLLEVGAGIRDKYQKQSQVTSQEWLYKALDILGVADVSYKASRNQRLHVELALIKLCNISGVSKKKALTSDELPTEEKPVQPTGQQEPKTYPDSSPAQPRKKIPGTLPSIKDALNGVSRTGKEEGKDAGRTIRQVLSSAFTQADLLEKWTEYADHIKEDKPRMSSSLKHHLPSLGDALQIEVIFSNSSQIEEFNRDIKHDLVSYLEDTLQNTQFRIIPVVQEVEGNENLLYTSEEKYDHMIKKNPNLGKLKERFNLDFE
ncbi:MAG: DNA polymerase III subunit gamma/tau [Bacteroidales bacterium]|nr:DNA polymerase III subunit gamma/tau [Bacteroidales bacterium]